MSAPAVSVKEEQHILRCKSDLPYYGKKHLVIRDKFGTPKALVYNFAQRFVHKKLKEQQEEKGFIRAIILKARQEGISTYTASRFYRRAHLFPMQRAMVLSNNTKNAQTIFEFYRRFQRFMDPSLVIPTTADRRDRALVLEHESEIEVGTANTETAGKGATTQMLHASEAAFWEKPDDIWTNLMPSIPTSGSEVIIESTANGVGNWFHQKWLQAEEGRSDYIAIFLPWWIHEEYTFDRITEEERDEIEESEDPFERLAQDEGIEWENRKRKLTPERLAWRRWAIANICDGNERKFRQEYPATAREAFLVSGNTFFDEEALERYEESIRPYQVRVNFVRSTKGGITPQPSERGFVKLWELPKEDGLYVIGADTAQGKQVAQGATSFSDPENERGGRDFNSADVLDLRTMRQVAQFHARCAPEVFAQQLEMLGYFYSSFNRPALIAVEKNHSCVDAETEALTPEGWKSFDQLAEGDLIRTLDPTTKLAQWQPVSALYVAEVEDEPMIRVDKHKHSSLTTPDHWWFVQRAKGDGSRGDVFTTSSDFRNHDRVLCAARSDDTLTEPIYDDAFVGLVGWFWTEGSINKKGGGSIRLAQSETHNPFYVKRIRELLTRYLGPSVERHRPGGNSKPPAGWRETAESHGMRRWYLNAEAGKDFLSVAPDRIPSPEFLTSLTEEQLWMFLQASMSAEASWSNPKTQWGVWIAQKRKEPLDAVQMAASLWGVGSSLVQKPNGQWHLSFHKEKNVLPAYKAHGNGVHKVSYTGTIWCPTVPNSIWLARRRGRVFYTGNSGETVLRVLKKEKEYPNLYYSRQINRRSDRMTPVLGWVTSRETRMPMLDELAQKIRDEQIDIACGDTIKECYTFVRGDDGKPEAQEGCHDDRVMSLAIAIQAGRTVPQDDSSREMPEQEYGTSPTGWGTY